MPDRCSTRAVRVGLTLLVAAGCAPAGPADVDDLVGHWVATPAHGDSTGEIRLEFVGRDGEPPAVVASLPAIGARSIPFGTATLAEDGRSVSIGNWVLDHDAGTDTLTGRLPESLVPVHPIDAVFRRTGPPDLPARTEPEPPANPPVWTFETGAAVWAGLVLADNRLLVANDAGRVLALDPDNGAVLWDIGLGAAVRAQPFVHEATIHVHADDGRLYALDSATAKVRWKQTLREGAYERVAPGAAGSRYDNFASGVATDGRRLFVGSSDGRIHALDFETGDPLWEFAAGDLVTGTPAVADGRVIATSFDGNVYALSADDGELLWKFDTQSPIPSSPAASGGRVIVGSRSYELFGLDARTGRPAWSSYYWFSWIDSDAVIDGPTAYVGSSDAMRLNAFDVASGELRWSTPTGGWTWARAAVTEDAVYTGTVGVADYIGPRRARFLAVDRVTGRPRWHHPLPDRPQGTWGFAAAPAAGTGRVFAADLDGRVHAFATAATRASTRTP